MIDERELYAPLKLKKPSRIFVCSTYEIFYQKHHSWRDGIFDVIKSCPQHTFQILTKMPENIDRPMPDNVWLGVSVEKGDDVGWGRISALSKATARIKFVSFEPLLGRISAGFLRNAEEFDWFIFGRLTGHGKKHDPKLIHLQVYDAVLRPKPVFLKHNLKDIWPGKLIQEFPE